MKFAPPRRHVAHLDTDRPLYSDHNAMKTLVKSCEILEEVEAAVGSLEPQAPELAGALA